MIKTLFLFGISGLLGLFLIACGGSGENTRTSPISTPLGATATPAPEVGAKAGNLTPDFIIEEAVNWTESPLPFKLSDLRGRVILINFWASWCRYCDAEMPSLQALHERYPQEDFVILGLNDGEDRGTAVGYVQKKNLTFPIVLDESKDVTRMYRVT